MSRRDTHDRLSNRVIPGTCPGMDAEGAHVPDTNCFTHL